MLRLIEFRWGSTLSLYSLFSGALDFLFMGLNPVPPAATHSISGLFVSASVALDTVLEVSNSFIQVLLTYLINLVFMAPIAGIMAVVIVDVTCCASRVVVFVEQE